MLYYHTEREISLDLTDAIMAHSGDITLTYKTVFGEDLSLSYYFPENYQMQECLFPSIVFIHGGGWRSRKIFPEQNGVWQGDYLGYLARFFSQKGYVCVSVDYRLIRNMGQKDGYQIIDCADDCADAVEYILQNAATFKINTNCVYLLGESAGGQLAGMLATRYKFKNFRFKRTFLFNSILNFEKDAKWKNYIPRESVHPALRSRTYESRMSYLSPEKGICSNMNPIVLFHGDCDHTVDKLHSENFYYAMKELDLPCDIHIMSNAQHAFLLAEYTVQHDICKNAILILQEALHNGAV